uniref:glutamate receptor ionotropic, NMDA 3B-like n=1 Tax=Myxine glutinosa TaxID=7769 RepID=UPI00358F187E
MYFVEMSFIPQAFNANHRLKDVLSAQSKKSAHKPFICFPFRQSQNALPSKMGQISISEVQRLYDNSQAQPLARRPGAATTYHVMVALWLLCAACLLLPGTEGHPEPCVLLAKIGHSLRLGLALPQASAYSHALRRVIRSATVARAARRALPYNLTLELVPVPQWDCPKCRFTTAQAADPAWRLRAICGGVVARGVTAILAFPSGATDWLQAELLGLGLGLPVLAVAVPGMETPFPMQRSLLLPLRVTWRPGPALLAHLLNAAGWTSLGLLLCPGDEPWETYRQFLHHAQKENLDLKTVLSLSLANQERASDHGSADKHSTRSQGLADQLRTLQAVPAPTVLAVIGCSLTETRNLLEAASVAGLGSRRWVLTDVPDRTGLSWLAVQGFVPKGTVAIEATKPQWHKKKQMRSQVFQAVDSRWRSSGHENTYRNVKPSASPRWHGRERKGGSEWQQQSTAGPQDHRKMAVMKPASFWPREQENGFNVENSRSVEKKDRFPFWHRTESVERRQDWAGSDGLPRAQENMIWLEAVVSDGLELLGHAVRTAANVTPELALLPATTSCFGASSNHLGKKTPGAFLYSFIRNTTFEGALGLVSMVDGKVTVTPNPTPIWQFEFNSKQGQEPQWRQVGEGDAEKLWMESTFWMDRQHHTLQVVISAAPPLLSTTNQAQSRSCESGRRCTRSNGRQGCCSGLIVAFLSQLALDLGGLLELRVSQGLTEGKFDIDLAVAFRPELSASGLDYIGPVLTTGIWVLSLESYNSAGLTTSISCLHWVALAALAACVGLASSAMVCFERATWGRGKKEAAKRKPQRQKLGLIIGFCCSLLAGRPKHGLPVKSHVAWLVGSVWATAGLFLIAGLTAQLVAEWTRLRQAHSIVSDILTVEQSGIFHRPKQRIAMVAGSAVETSLKQFPLHQPSIVPWAVKSAADGLELLRSGEVRGLMLDGVTAWHTIAQDSSCRFSLTGPLQWSTELGLAVTPGSPFLQPIADLMEHYHDTGVLNKLQTQWLNLTACASHVETHQAWRLDIADFSSLFAFLAAGLALSLLIAAGECLAAYKGCLHPAPQARPGELRGVIGLDSALGPLDSQIDSSVGQSSTDASFGELPLPGGASQAIETLDDPEDADVRAMASVWVELTELDREIASIKQQLSRVTFRRQELAHALDSMR